MNGPSRRSLLLCKAFAKNSLPLPVSPVIKTLIGELTNLAARSICLSSVLSPPDKAASGAGMTISALPAWLPACTFVGESAETNNNFCEPCMRTARLSAGLAETNRGNSSISKFKI